MDINDYQKQALNSVALPKKHADSLAHRTLGLSGEAGEVASIIKKIIRDKNGKAEAEDLEQIREKLGDTLYYIAVLAEYFNIDLAEVAAKNLDKSAKFKQNSAGSKD